MNTDKVDLQDAKRALAEHHERLKALERDYTMLKARLDRLEQGAVLAPTTDNP